MFLLNACVEHREQISLRVSLRLHIESSDCWTSILYIPNNIYQPQNIVSNLFDLENIDFQ